LVIIPGWLSRLKPDVQRVAQRVADQVEGHDHETMQAPTG
jgi:hypothetical protein